MIAGSLLLRWGFITLAAALAAAFCIAVRVASLRTGVDARTATRQARIAAIIALLWLGGTGVAAASGALQFTSPPTMMIVLALTFVLSIGTALSPLGARLATGLPMSVLVGYQGFRVIVELLLHRAYIEGLMPVQMSYAGRNFDIVSGATALALGLWLARGHMSTRLVFAWNTLGVVLLANIVGIALLSAPTPLRYFMNEPSNVWITRAPWVWLPAAMVFAAVLGHVLVFRRLRLDARANLQRAAVT